MQQRARQGKVGAGRGGREESEKRVRVHCGSCRFETYAGSENGREEEEQKLRAELPRLRESVVRAAEAEQDARELVEAKQAMLAEYMELRSFRRTIF